jgi:hypothetical protein
MQPTAFLKSQAIAGLLASCLGVSPVFAENCPTAKTAGKGFTVERGERSKTEVFHAGETEVRSVFAL